MATSTTESAGIRATGLTKSYGAVQALRGIDLHIAPGETVALLGPNGAGKTTTIDILLGLTRPDAAAVSPGAHLALDRSRGWRRQLRLTPLRARTDHVAKALSAYLVAVPALLLLFHAGASLGVRLGATQWLEMTGLLLVGLAPFVLMGVVLGHVLEPDALVPAAGGLVVLFALFGGAYGSLFNGGPMLTFVKLLPSFWLVQAGKAALVLGSWPAEGWIVVATWTAVLVPVAVLAYRRDTARV